MIEPNRRRSSAPGGIILIIVAAFGIMAGAFGLRYYRTLPSVRLTSLLEEAQESYAAGDVDTARSIYMDALDMDPSHAETYQGLLAVYSGANDYAAVTNLIRNLPSSVPEEAAQSLRLEAVEYIATAATASMASEDYESALSLYRSIVAVAGNDIDLAAPARNRVQELEARLYGTGSDNSPSPDVAVKVVDRIGGSAGAGGSAASAGAASSAVTAQAGAAGGGDASPSLESIGSTEPASPAVLALSGTDLLRQLQSLLRDNSYVAAIQLMSAKNFQAIVTGHREEASDGVLVITAETLQSGTDVTEQSTGSPSSSDGEAEVDPDNIWQPIPEEEKNDTVKSEAGGSSGSTASESGTSKSEATGSTAAGSDSSESEASGSGSADSTTADSNSTKSDASGSGSADSTAADSDAAKNNASGSGSADSTVAGSETAKSEEAGSASAESGSSKNDASGAAGSATAGSDTAKNEASGPDVSGSDASRNRSSEATASSVSENVEIRVHIAGADKTFTVSTYDGTELTVNLPSVKDENGRTVLGIYGKDQYGYGNYVLEGGRTMTADEYLGLSEP